MGGGVGIEVEATVGLSETGGGVGAVGGGVGGGEGRCEGSGDGLFVVVGGGVGGGLGVFVGFKLGSKDGIALGFIEGLVEGFPEGLAVGCMVGGPIMVIELTPVTVMVNPSKSIASTIAAVPVDEKVVELPRVLMVAAWVGVRFWTMKSTV